MSFTLRVLATEVSPRPFQFRYTSAEEVIMELCNNNNPSDKHEMITLKDVEQQKQIFSTAKSTHLIDHILADASLRHLGLTVTGVWKQDNFVINEMTFDSTNYELKAGDTASRIINSIVFKEFGRSTHELNKLDVKTAWLGLGVVATIAIGVLATAITTPISFGIIAAMSVVGFGYKLRSNLENANLEVYKSRAKNNLMGEISIDQTLSFIDGMHAQESWKGYFNSFRTLKDYKHINAFYAGKAVVKTNNVELKNAYAPSRRLDPLACQGEPEHQLPKDYGKVRNI